MSYGTFVKALNKNAEGGVIAYDNKKNHEGCLLHLRKRPLTIFVPVVVIDHYWSEALSALSEKMRDLDQIEEHLVLVPGENGTLLFKPSTKAVNEPACSACS